MEKKTYCEPKIHCVELDVKDIIATSTDTNPIGGPAYKEPD